MTQTIFHASFTCTKSGRVDRKSETEKFTQQMTKDNFWQWVKDHYDSFSKQYDSVIIDSISMI